MLNVGDRVKVKGTKADARRWWTVRAVDQRYVILTRQADFQPKGVIYYSIIDWERGVRGPCNLIFGYDVTLPQGPDNLLNDLNFAHVEVSYRNNIEAEVLEVRCV
jgi:hypothetical protein